MNRAPLRFWFAWSLAWLMVLTTVGESWAQTVTVRVTPTAASTLGGTPIDHNISGGGRGVSATVDGVPTPFIDHPYGVIVIAPPRSAPGEATLVLNGTHSVWGPFTTTTTITYLDLPRTGLTTPVTRVSVDGNGAQSLGGVNWSGNHSSASSADGRYVAFLSDSSFSGVPVGGTLALHVKDRVTGDLTKSTCPGGGVCSAPSISLDGTRVAYGAIAFSGAISGIYTLDAPFTSTPTVVDVDGLGTAHNPSSVALSGNGRFIAFTSAINTDGAPGDVTGTRDLFVRDLQLGVTERWTTSASSATDVTGDISITADGRYVVFVTAAPLVTQDTNTFRDVYLLDRSTGTLRCLTPGGNGHSGGAAISVDGGAVALASAASNLVNDDTNAAADVFVADLVSGQIARITPAGGGSLGGRWAISGDGHRVAFASTVPNLPASVAGVYVHDRRTGETWHVNAAADGTIAGPIFRPFGTSIPSAALTPDGRAVTFSTIAPELVSGDTNAVVDVFRKELPENSPIGANVTVTPVNPSTGTTPVALSFDEITGPGDTTVVVMNTPPELPAGYQLGSQFLDISTTASSSGAISVCIYYDPLTTPDPAALRLLHYEGSAWVDITTGFNAVTHVVCGSTTSLSPFVLAIPPRPTFAVRSLLEDGRVFKAGSTIPIRVQVVDAGGANVSAASLPLVATGVRLVSSQTDWATPEDPGQSNPDLNFQFTEVEGEPGYRFNLKTTGLAAGTYALQFRVGADGPTLSVEFQVR